MKVSAIIQARRSSTRFPDKIFKLIEKKPLLWHVVNRLRPSRTLDEIIIATTENEEDNKIVAWGKENNVKVFRGSQNDVLNRYYEAAKYSNSNVIVRITADDPFKDYRLIDQAVDLLQKGNYDFVSNNNPVSYPEGLDVEVLTFATLKLCNELAEDAFEKEHVTQYIFKNPDKFYIKNISSDVDLSSFRWTIDTEDDFVFATEVYKKLHFTGRLFLTEDICKLLNASPELAEINKEVKRSTLYNK
jgi:spore coat polysaccharide biosynthesis protein SpsF